MSELRAGVIVTPHDEGMCFNRGSDVIAVTERETEFYLKYEADKVIAELEERVADGDKDFEMVNHQNERLLKIVRHHKYKRCLAMVWLCEAMRGHYLSYEEPKWFWWRKWSKRWLELAEKFKEA